MACVNQQVGKVGAEVAVEGMGIESQQLGLHSELPGSIPQFVEFLEVVPNALALKVLNGMLNGDWVLESLGEGEGESEGRVYALILLN